MKILPLLALAATAGVGVMAENNDVVVLVHGLGGNAASFEYKEEFEEAGLRTIPVEVNGYASNHDRAAELYAQMKGLVVDYGVCHSRAFGHLRFGEDFTGKALYPEWDENHRIHLVGHSMGGTTIRSLERLLEDGSGCPEDESELYQGGNNWITSITTMASPMDGTTIFDNVFGFDEMLVSVFIGFSSFSHGDLDFIQWGLVQGPDETMDEFIERLEDSGLFDEEDFSIHDLNVDGSAAFNALGPQTYPGRYYFSYAGERTSLEVDCKLGRMLCDSYQAPDKEMNLDLKPSARLIGRQAEPVDQPNDGIVNQARARCPTGTNCLMVEDGSTDWAPDRWHVVDIGFLDHYQITDRDNRNDKNNFKESAKRIYLEHGVRLKNLPSFSRADDLEEEEKFERREKKAAVERFLRSKEKFERREKKAAVERFLRSKEIMKSLQPAEEVEGVSGGQVFGAVLGFSLLGVVAIALMVMGKKRINSRTTMREGSEGMATKQTL